MNGSKMAQASQVCPLCGQMSRFKVKLQEAKRLARANQALLLSLVKEHCSIAAKSSCMDKLYN